MGVLLRLADGIDWLNATLGRLFSWIIALLIVVMTAIVVLRYAFGFGLPVLGEIAIYAHAIMYMTLAAWVLQLDQHVRVDVLYRLGSERRRALLNLIGIVLFVWPMIWALLTYGWPYVAQSWRIRERGAVVSGLGAVYVLKSFIIVFAVLVGLQSLAWAIRCVHRLTGTREA